MSSSDELRERIAASIADGERVDWATLERQGLLSPTQLRALRLLEQLRTSSARRAERSSTGDAPAAPELEGGFELLDEIGRGTTARVWRALDKALDREVALKVPHQDLAVPERARERFVQEARVLAALRHPNIVGIHSIVERAGQLYLNLELIRGISLEQLVRERGRLSPQEAARIGIDVCRALAAMHERGIVHRDVKPGNVMREDGGRIVLLDFSLARSADPDARWQSASFAGTPMFMAPEQFEGRDTIGPSTDVYGLGALLYWLVAGRPACEGESLAAVKQRVLAGRTTPMVDARPDVPPGFTKIVERALRRDERERYATAGEMERELLSFVSASERAADTAAAQTTPRSARPGRRRWVWLALLAVAAAAWPVVRLLGHPAPPEVECQLEQRRGQLALPLADGDEIGVGDQLFLRVRADRAAHLYVFDVDARGQMFTLFPLADFELRNPLAAKVEHELPGTRSGERRDWQVTSRGGGAEWVVVVAAAEPLEEFEALVRTVAPALPDAPLEQAPLDQRQRTALLRGIGGTAPAAGAAGASAGPQAHVPAIVDELSRLHAAGDRRAWVRVLRLRTRD